MDKYNGEKQCFQCLNCAEGTGLREISSCKFHQNTVCEPLEGFFCVSGSVDRCVAAQQHSTCAPGQYISTAGTSSTDTVCGDCSEGTFSDGTFMSCQNHTQCSRLQQPGTISSDSVCLEGLTAAEWTGVVAGISAVICVPLCLLIKRICCKRKETREPRVFHANNATCEALIDEEAPPLPSAVVLTDEALLDDAGAEVPLPSRMDQLSWGT
ncbi:tumor necrosis factor receptor superfamily member 14-like [Synchiropus picturatus]